MIFFILLICIFWSGFQLSHSFIQPRSCVISDTLNQRNQYNTKPFNTHCKPCKSMELHGIPRLFRWLVDLYPIVLESVRDGLTSKNAMAIDNFYLDMNGIIHACTHSNNDKLIEADEVQQFKRIFAYTDNLYKLVKPSKLMFLAVDGVAPRAKQNQQRSRRFRSSKEREVLLAQYVAKEGKLPDEESFDSNCITPGTQFMHRLGIAFRSWMQHKMKTDSFWRENGATVIFSGPDVPGEGEHKVMDMIRDIQSSEGYKLGSLRHCMYGLDADLIMLSLATHEPHFVLLREKINRRKTQHKDEKGFSQEYFELLEITLLRQMLKQHFRKLAKPKESDSLTVLKSAEAEELIEESVKRDMESSSMRPAWEKSISRTESPEHEERVVDDFIFMCFFIGNDFLPSLPHTDIVDGSLTHMMEVYRDMIPTLKGYLTKETAIHLPRVEYFIQEIARREALYFQQRAITDKEPDYATEKYKEVYYKNKFGIEPGDKESVRKIVEAYVNGLVWVLIYYHKGCGSWTWYYPYLYAPLASDLVNLKDIKINFVRGVPFTPLLQLLSVLPPQSGKFLPSSYEELMTTPGSPIYPYYPKDFEVDSNGKKNSWECVVKIPFIDEATLVNTISTIDHDKELTDEEKTRNLKGKEFRVDPPRKANKDDDSLEVQDRGTSKDSGDNRWGNALLDDARRYPRSSTSNSSPSFRKRQMEPADVSMMKPRSKGF